LQGVAALRLQRRAEQVRDLDASLVVWPEAISRRRLSLQEGEVDVQVTPPSETPSTHVMGILNRPSGRVQNSAMVMTHEGHVFWHRGKIALAGMGEEARFGIRLGNSQDMLRGEIDPVVEVEGRRIGVLICSEVFDAEMRERATPEGVDLVVVLAGDAITGGEASGRELMLNAAILAAAEQGVSIARASTRGVAALIGPDGTVYARVDSGHLRAARMPTSPRAP
jgi:apolipoprotein N-acyltransferase